MFVNVIKDIKNNKFSENNLPEKLSFIQDIETIVIENFNFEVIIDMLLSSLVWLKYNYDII